ncbi:hypothetical protein SAMN05216554_1258 [Herbiconiux ginsengi]|uniref:Uncharacterized protein n=1 Tax=Herbiconiux ginsengi TaxID=381665 RepID=A0A1H3M3I0_9MICO|nr:hypothetical protein SAMN05216554_1258 [Herbiconiux ginsengi]
MSTKSVRIHYTNYRGVTDWRVIEPEAIWFGSTEWHPEPQWLLDAVDVERGEKRTFALVDLHEWRENTDTP